MKRLFTWAGLVLASLALEAAPPSRPVQDPAGAVFWRALGQFESGWNEHAIGPASERGVWQIHPRVLKGRPANLATAVAVMAPRWKVFENRMHRRPQPGEAYLLWNAPGAFRKAGYDRGRVSVVLQARAGRFEREYARQVLLATRPGGGL